MAVQALVTQRVGETRKKKRAKRGIGVDPFHSRPCSRLAAQRRRADVHRKRGLITLLTFRA